MDSAISRTS